MTTITHEQARVRFATLPESLQNALFSFQTAEIISRIGEQNHLKAEKTSIISEAAGLVLLGFIHPEELSKEIQDRSGLGPQVSGLIAESISQRLFASLRSDIDRVYAPAVEPHEGPVIQEIKKSPEGPKPVELATATPPASSKTAAPATTVAAPPAKPIIEVTPASAGRPAAPVTLKPLTPTSPVAPKSFSFGTGPVPARPASASPAPPQKSMSEVSPIKPSSPAPAAAGPIWMGATKPAPQSGGPAPIFLRKETEIGPVKPKTDLQFDLPAPRIHDMKSPAPAAPRVVLELGKDDAQKKPVGGVTRIEPPKPRIVHYNQWGPQLTPKSPDQKSMDMRSSAGRPSPAPIGKAGVIPPLPASGRPTPPPFPPQSKESKPTVPPLQPNAPQTQMPSAPIKSNPVLPAPTSPVPAALKPVPSAGEPAAPRTPFASSAEIPTAEPVREKTATPMKGASPAPKAPSSSAPILSAAPVKPAIPKPLEAPQPPAPASMPAGASQKTASPSSAAAPPPKPAPPAAGPRPAPAAATPPTQTAAPPADKPVIPSAPSKEPAPVEKEDAMIDLSQL